MSKSSIKPSLRPPAFCAGAAMLLGLLVLFGWAADLPWLTRMSLHWNAMQPMTAVSFILAGLALYFFVVRRWRAAMAVLVPLAAIPGCALVEHWSGHPLGIDFLLFPDAVQTQAHLRYPGRMAEISAIEFLLFCLFLAWPRRTPRQYREASRTATLGLLVALIGLAGYVLNAHELARVGSYASMAAPTAGGFILLFTGALLAQRDPNWLRRLLAPVPGAQLARRLLTHILGWPVLLGLALPVAAPIIGNPQLQFALYVVALTTGLVVIVLRFTKRLQRAESHRRQATVALGTSEARLSGVLASTMDAVITIDQGQRIVFFNPAAEEAFGYGTAEVIGSPIDLLIPQRFRQAHAGHVRRFGETGVTSRSMGRLGSLSALKKDGSEFPIEASISQVEVEGQKLFTVILRDITERQRAEDLLRATFEQAAVGMAHVALDGRWLQVNDRLCQIVGYEREELLRLSFQDITYLPDLSSDLAQVQQLLDGAIPHYSMEKRYIHRDGSLVWINLTASLVHTATGEPDYFISVVEDIQRRKEVEADLDAEREAHREHLEQQVAERTQELMAANRELEIFTYAASHDLRGPLRRIKSISSLLETNYRKCLEKEGLRFMEVIRQNANRLSELVDVLLEHARAAQQTQDKRPINVLSLTQAVLQDKDQDIQALKVEVRLQLPSAQVLADPQGLAQVLGNLVENALKYSARTARPVIEIGGEGAGDCFRLWVRDNGIGFDMVYHDKIFEIFQRLHSYSEYTGSGVGLALVKRTMERMGGKVWAESELGKGATFFLELPGITEALNFTPTGSEGKADDQPSS